jgi:hypothetical protein
MDECLSTMQCSPIGLRLVVVGLGDPACWHPVAFLQVEQRLATCYEVRRRGQLGGGWLLFGHGRVLVGFGVGRHGSRRPRLPGRDGRCGGGQGGDGGDQSAGQPLLRC